MSCLELYLPSPLKTSCLPCSQLPFPRRSWDLSPGFALFYRYRNKATLVAALPEHQQGKTSTYPLSRWTSVNRRALGFVGTRRLDQSLQAARKRVPKRRGRHRQSQGLLDKPALVTALICLNGICARDGHSPSFHKHPAIWVLFADQHYNPAPAVCRVLLRDVGQGPLWGWHLVSGS